MSKQINDLNKASAPINAQKNSDITKAEIEDKLTGTIDTHRHTILTVKTDNSFDAASLPSAYPRGEILFFSSSPENKFNGLNYGLVQTFRHHATASAAIQYLYPYNTDADKIFVRSSVYGTDAWRDWAEVYTSLNKPSLNDLGAASASSIGTLNNLQTTNKSTLVDAINEAFQFGNNVKENLVEALIAKNIDCSTSDTFETLISKINELPDILKLIKIIKPGDTTLHYSNEVRASTCHSAHRDSTIVALPQEIISGLRFKANIGTQYSSATDVIYTRVKLLRDDIELTSISETLFVPAAGQDYIYDIHYPIQNNDVIRFEFSFEYENLGTDITAPGVEDPCIIINSQKVLYSTIDSETDVAIETMIAGDKNLLTSNGGGTWVNNGTPGQVTLTIPTLPTTFKGATLNITTYAGGDTYYVYYTPTVLVNRNGETIVQLFYPDVDEVYLDGDGVRRTISRTLTDLKAGDTIFCQFDITNGKAVNPFPKEYYFVIDNITVTYDTVDLVADSVEPKKMTYGTDHVLVSSSGYNVESSVANGVSSDTLVIPALPYDFEGATLYMKGKATGQSSNNIWFTINILDSDNNFIKRINDDYLQFNTTDTEFTFNIDTLQTGYKVYVEATVYNPYEPMTVATPEKPAYIAELSEISIRYNLN